MLVVALVSGIHALAPVSRRRGGSVVVFGQSVLNCLLYFGKALNIVGVLLCRLVTGEPIVSYIYDATIKARLPASVRPLLERTLGFDSAERFDSCDALIAALDNVLWKTEMLESPAAMHETPTQGSVILPDGDTPPRGTKPPFDPSVAKNLPFERLGHFRILAQIGGGGMGDVYRGYDESLDRPVAIKVLPPQLARDAEFVRRFHAEATAAASVAHPNVVPIYFIGEEAGHHFFAMQYVDGESLAARLKRQGPLAVDEALELVGQCLAGLQAAHAKGLIHRDVKPANILIERNSGRAMLVDFGLVRRLGEDSRMTATGVVMGTVDYIAPEQARGRNVDARTDIYALGVLWYQLISGRLPFVADSPTAMIFQHAYEAPFPLEKAAPGVPPAVAQIIARMMAKEPEERYSDCGAVLADVAAYRQGQPLASPAAAPARVTPAGVAVQLPPQQSVERPPQQTVEVPAQQRREDLGPSARYSAELPELPELPPESGVARRIRRPAKTATSSRRSRLGGHDVSPPRAGIRPGDAGYRAASGRRRGALPAAPRSVGGVAGGRPPPEG